MAEGYTTASSDRKSEEKSEWNFNHRSLQAWREEKQPGEFLPEIPKYYSTTSGFGDDDAVIKRQLFENDTVNMKLLNKDIILSKPSLQLQLMQGITPIKEFGSRERMKILMKGLIKHEMAGSSKFVCHSEVLIQVGLTAYSDKIAHGDKGLKIAVEKVGETIYMYTISPSKKEAKALSCEENKKKYIQLKFGQYLAQKPGETPKPTENIDPSLDFCALMKARLGNHDMIISGQIDCLDCEGQRVALKTSEEDFEDVDPWVQMTWWLQCHLLGVKSLVLGKHRTYGTQCECMGVTEHPLLPRLCIPCTLFSWDSEICLAAIHKFLSSVEEHAERVKKPFVLRREKRSQNFVPC